MHLTRNLQGSQIWLFAFFVILTVGCSQKPPAGMSEPKQSKSKESKPSSPGSSETAEAKPTETGRKTEKPPRLDITVTEELPTIPKETQPLGTILTINPQIERKMKLLRLTFSHESGASMSVNLGDSPVDFPVPAIDLGKSASRGDTKWKVKAEGWEPGEGDKFGAYCYFWESELWVASPKSPVSELPIRTDSRYPEKTTLAISRSSAPGFCIHPEMHHSLEKAPESSRFVFLLPKGSYKMSRWHEKKFFKWNVEIRAE